MMENYENRTYDENMKHGWHLKKLGGSGGAQPPICKQNDLHNSSKGGGGSGSWKEIRLGGEGRGRKPEQDLMQVVYLWE